MIDIYVKDIKRSLKSKCYFSALALALALPDMCAMAEYPKESSVKKRYMQWYDTYLEKYMEDIKKYDEEENPLLNGYVIYKIRNTFLHTVSPNINNDKIKNGAEQIDKVTFFLGNDKIFWNSYHLKNVKKGKKVKIAAVNVTVLCNCICDCALQYY